MLLFAKIKWIVSFNYKYFLADSLFSKPYKNLDHVKIANLTEYEYVDNLKDYDSDLREYLIEIREEEKRLKLSTCLILIKNLLSKTPNKVIDAVQNSKLDKLKTFDKIYAEMLNNCVETINGNDCIKILDDNNLNNIDDLSSNKYLKFDAKRFLIIGPDPKLSEEEKNIMKLIQEISKGEDKYSKEVYKTNNPETDEDKSSINGRSNYIFQGMLIGLLIGIIYGLTK